MANTFELTAELLKPLLTRMTGDESAEASEFKLTALKPGVGNPTSKGVYRASGTAKTSSGLTPFSFVVKHLADGQPFMDASSTKSWNYWKREIDFFESPVAARIPASLGFPKYLGQSTLPDGTALFWNQDMGDLTKSKWTWAKCVQAARVVAELNSIDISDAPQYDWLCRDMLGGWAEFRDEYFFPVFPLAVECAKSTPRTAAAFDVYGKYMDKHYELANIVYSARQTFVHGDFNLNNLVSAAGSAQEVIALDWQLCGISGIGVDLVSIFNTLVECNVIEPTPELFEEMCAAYTDSFNAVNPDNPVTLNEVRLVAAAMGYSIWNSMAFFFVRSSPDEPLEQTKIGVQKLVDSYTAGAIMIYSAVLNELVGDI